MKMPRKLDVAKHAYSELNPVTTILYFHLTGNLNALAVQCQGLTPLLRWGSSNANNFGLTLPPSSTALSQ